LAAIVLVATMVLKAQPLAIAGIHAYQHTLSPLAARVGVRCRFTPSCSRYAEAVIAREGAMRGGWKTVKRIARCGPWTRPGTVDEP
jgi:putative membrane protein insertion efficiency factor